jgi:formate dehydrogenase
LACGWTESKGHAPVSTSETGAELDRELEDADVVVAPPFGPVYLTRGRPTRAPKLKLLLTAGVGSDHFDLAAAAERRLPVAEITGSHVASVAEHVVMQILALVRSFIRGYLDVVQDGRNIGPVAARSHDLEDRVVGSWASAGAVSASRCR